MTYVVPNYKDVAEEKRLVALQLEKERVAKLEKEEREAKARLEVEINFILEEIVSTYKNTSTRIFRLGEKHIEYVVTRLREAGWPASVGNETRKYVSKYGDYTVASPVVIIATTD
jgi:hypothetical protein